MSQANLLAQHLRSCAWWRLDTAGASAIRVARSVVALLDTAAFLGDIPDDDPAIRALSDAGCFATGAFDPGERGAALIRGWQLADKPTAGPRDLLAALAAAVSEAGTPKTAAGKVPAAPKPAVSETAAPNPAVSEPAAPKPAVSEPAAPKPAAPKAGVSEAAVREPAALKAAVSDGAVPKAAVSKVPAARKAPESHVTGGIV